MIDFIGDEEIEKAVLSCGLTDKESLHIVVSELEPRDFCFTDTRKIFESMREINSQDGDVCEMTLITRNPELTAYVSLLDLNYPYKYNLENWIKELKDYRCRRSLESAAFYLTKTISDKRTPLVEIVDKANSFIWEATRDDNQSSIIGSDQIVPKTEMLLSRKSGVVGINTGLLDLDRQTQGMEPGHLWILAGRPGHGKTLTALNIMRMAAEIGQTVFFSLEMVYTELLMRMLAKETMTNYRKVRGNTLSEFEKRNLIDASKFLSNLGINVCEISGLKPQDIVSQSKRLHRKYGGLSLVVIDYLGLLNVYKTGNLSIDLGEASRLMKVLAKDLGCPVLALHQLNRECEKREDKRPLLSDLRDSGALEQDADVVLFVYRDCMYNDQAEKGVMEIIIGKNRHGETGIVEVFCNPEFMAVGNLHR